MATNFDAALLRLKGALQVQTDKEVAGLLGMSPTALNDRKRRDAFPEDKVRALSLTRHFDAEYVITGVAQAALEMIQAARDGKPLKQVTPEDQALLAYWHQCEPADQALLLQLIRRLTPSPNLFISDPEAHRAVHAQERDAKIARSLAKAWDKGVGVTATPDEAAISAAAKKESEQVERPRERASRKPV